MIKLDDIDIKQTNFILIDEDDGEDSETWYITEFINPSTDEKLIIEEYKKQKTLYKLIPEIPTNTNYFEGKTVDDLEILVVGKNIYKEIDSVVQYVPNNNWYAKAFTNADKLSRYNVKKVFLQQKKAELLHIFFQL